MDVGSSLQCLYSAGLVLVVVKGCCYVITSAAEKVHANFLNEMLHFVGGVEVGDTTRRL